MLLSDDKSNFKVGTSATSDGLVYALKSMKGATWTISRVHARGALNSALACVPFGDMDSTQVISNIAKLEDPPNLLPLDSIKPVFLRA